MKRNALTLNGELTCERISAKDVFALVEAKGEGNHDGFSIYDVTPSDEDNMVQRFRVDCGDLGSFEVTKMDGDEEYSIIRNDWIFIEGIFYRYSSSSFGYPNLPIEKAYDFLKTQNGK
jgi:hypothetical protein